MAVTHVIGGGPAGSAAAISAMAEGSAVKLFEKSRFPRHKVCGEFLSPEIAPLLDKLGLAGDFDAARPAVIRRMTLHFRSSEKRCPLPETAYGLSRYRFDHLLLEAARERGVEVVREAGKASPLTVAAHGRKAAAPRGRRLFGFKAHYEGTADDAVELYFFGRCYVGINTVENGITNVCGLAPERLLRERNFEVDELLDTFAALAERLQPLRRVMDWLMAGPLVFENRFRSPMDVYAAGDALSFVDPFTGSGMVSAVLTGTLAGEAAARGIEVEQYVRDCRRHLERPFLVSSIFRSAVSNGWGEYLAPIVPGRWLVRFTRPA